MTTEPKHPGRRWRRLIFEAQMTQAAVARAIEVSPKHVNQIVNGRALPSPTVARRFAELVHVDPDKLWRDVAAYKLATAPDGDG